MSLPTPDLCDEHPGKVKVADPVFQSFGGLDRFEGYVSTVKCFEDNSLVKSALDEAGEQRLLVIDGGASLRRALLGDMLAAKAVANGWRGVIINGCLRDVDEINSMALGVRALACHPMKTDKRGEGQRDIAVCFAGIDWQPGHYVYVDNNGIIITPEKL